LHVTINEETTLRTVRVGDWTFRQSDKVRELTGMLPGDVFARHVADDPAATLAFAIVAYLLAGKDPDELPDMGIDSIVLDLSDETEEEPNPPAEGVAAEASGAKK
jgi:hypothetical protein